MSKRNSLGGGSNTLFNYFNKSPQTIKIQKTQVSSDISSAAIDKPNVSPNIVRKPNGNCTDNKRERSEEKDLQNDVSSEEDSPIAPRKKRKRIIPANDSDDSDSENKTVVNEILKSDHSVKDKLENSFKFEHKDVTPVGTPSRKQNSSKPKEIKKSSADASQPIADNDDGQNWTHCRLDWLKPNKIRDAKKRKPDHPDYDSKTLFVPEEFKKNQTPAHKQWWEMKSAHYDCVLFFKVGKFYELYHMDAAVGVNELGFSYMKGDFAHSGFPESAYAKMASILVSKGYKVARVEQTETPEMMQERIKRTGMNSKFDKVVRREICQLTCRGTEICGLQDNGPSQTTNSFMLSVAEEDQGNGSSKYGVCFIDTSIGLFNLGQFQDDQQCSRLLTTVAHYPPALIIYEKRITTGRTLKVFNTACYSARKESLLPETQFWSAEKTLKTLAEKYYKTNSDGEWPEGLTPILSESDVLGLTPHKDFTLAVKALGGCVYFLQEALLDVQIMGMSQFTSYNPPDAACVTLKHEEWKQGSNMVLDAITLRNLRIVDVEYSLYEKLNLCVTPMGKRLLHHWICSPSCNLQAILERQEAISGFLNDQSLAQDVKNILCTLPDLERLLAKIHSLGNLKRSTDHPDSRAIFYEEKTYSKKKVLDFISVLNGFEGALKISELLADTKSTMLRGITQMQPEGKFPNYADILKFFKEAFNHAEAEKEGRIVPSHGVDKEYDSSFERIKEIEDELKDYLKEQEKFFKCRVTYFGSDKRRYQLEVAESAARKAGSDYQLEGSKKGAKRFSTAETKDMLSRMIAAEEQKSSVLRDLSRRIFEKFSQSYDLWESAVRCLSILDVVLSLAEYVRLQPGEMCIPNVCSSKKGQKPYISIAEGRHPSIPLVEDYIPNDIHIGTDASGSQVPSLMLLTGPNMGGKSTLMRQAALLAIMAQIGCHIPAQACSMTLIDRIFTRLGASDDILTGQSTFLVEMNETAAILKHASVHSLVLLDELGRGTSTYDGMAIAGAVVDDIANRGCRTVFSTHYHNLVEDFKSDPRIRLAHMACMVETEETTEDELPEETVTFLYKVADGACPKSYGFNVARLAGLPNRIVKRGQQIARRIEKEADNIRTFRNIVNHYANAGETSLREMIAKLRV